MLALEIDETKIRRGKWKHIVIVKSFSHFKCYMQGPNTRTFKIASAEPPVVAPMCASCFTAVFH